MPPKIQGWDPPHLHSCHPIGGLEAPDLCIKHLWLEMPREVPRAKVGEAGVRITSRSSREPRTQKSTVGYRKSRSHYRVVGCTVSPRNSGIEVLSPGSSECDLIWK